MAVLAIVIMPLVYVRRREKPRRPLTVWWCDILKMAFAYSFSEIVVTIISSHGPMPMGMSLGPRGPSPDMGGPPPLDDGRRPPFEPGSIHDLHALPPLPDEPPHWERRRFFDGYRVQSTSLLVQTFDSVPGTVAVCLLYILALRLAHRLEVAVRGRRHSKQALGYLGGNYGNPVNYVYFFKQTALLTGAATMVKMATREMSEHHPEQFMSMADALFGFTRDINPALRWFLLSMVVPYVLFSAQFVLTDFMIKRRSAVSRSSRVLPLSETHALDSELDAVNDDDECYPLQELSAPQVGTIDLEAQNIPMTSPASQSSQGAQSSTSSRGSPVPALGIVTASLLNAAAVISTASQRADIFADNSPSCSAAGPSEPPAGGQGGLDDDGLPSYDDSQREQAQLRTADPARAQQRDLLIAELKR